MEMSVSSETTFFNMKLQLEICPQLRTGSSAEERGRINRRKCTVTGIDSHELQGLYVVQCAALVETNHGIDT